jgi:hypothetical protein
MQRVLADENGDVEKRADIAQVPKVALVRCAAKPLDIGLEVERGAVHVPYADGTASDPEGMDRPGGTEPPMRAARVCHSLPIKMSSEPSSTSHSSVRGEWIWG